MKHSLKALLLLESAVSSKEFIATLILVKGKKCFAVAFV